MIIIVNVLLCHRDLLSAECLCTFRKLPARISGRPRPFQDFNEGRSLLKRATSTRILNTITFYSTNAMITKSRTLYCIVQRQRSGLNAGSSNVLSSTTYIYIYVCIIHIPIFAFLKSNLRIFL